MPRYRSTATERREWLGLGFSLDPGETVDLDAIVVDPFLERIDAGSEPADRIAGEPEPVEVLPVITQDEIDADEPPPEQPAPEPAPPDLKPTPPATLTGDGSAKGEPPAPATFAKGSKVPGARPITKES